MRCATWTGAIASALIATACAATRPPTWQLVESRTAVRVADGAGAYQAPQARLYLTVARQQLAEAELLIVGGNYVQAAHTLEEAQVNAELAVALAREANARAEAIATQRDVDQLKTRVPGRVEEMTP